MSLSLGPAVATGPEGGKEEEEEDGGGRCLFSLPLSLQGELQRCSALLLSRCEAAAPPRQTFGGDPEPRRPPRSGAVLSSGAARSAGAAATPEPGVRAGGGAVGCGRVPSFPFGFFGTDAVGPVFALYATGRDARSWRRRRGAAARRFRGAFFVAFSGKVRRGGGGEPTVFRNSPSVVYLCTSRVHDKRVRFATPEFYIVFNLLFPPLFFLLK